MAKSQEKTNAMRILDRAGIACRTHSYDAADGKIDGGAVAEKLGIEPARVFKTLVTKGAGGEYLVFVVPVLCELDLKAAARAAGEKSVELIPVKDLQRVTGYIRGGCSPVGMKKALRTVIDESCLGLDTMLVSAGRIGRQIELGPGDLIHVTGGVPAAICRPGRT